MFQSDMVFSFPLKHTLHGFGMFKRHRTEKKKDAKEVLLIPAGQGLHFLMFPH